MCIRDRCEYPGEVNINIIYAASAASVIAMAGHSMISPVGQDNVKQRHAFHGLYRSLVNNMVIGVSEGYKKELELVGVGYRCLLYTSRCV